MTQGFLFIQSYKQWSRISKGKLITSVLDQSTVSTQLLQSIAITAVKSYPSNHYLQEIDTHSRKDKKNNTEQKDHFCMSVYLFRCSPRETATMRYSKVR